MSDDNAQIERRQSTADKADAAHTLASVNAALLTVHAKQDSDMFLVLNDKVDKISDEVKGINKWIWVATGVMLAASKLIDFFAEAHK